MEQNKFIYDSKKKSIGFFILGIIGIIALVVFGLTPPIEQDENYHNFSDRMAFGGIPNFWNVISNLPFLIVGLLGIVQIKKMDKSRNQFLIFFIGISLVAFGSGYYHYNPNDTSLIWDRLPMTIVFMSLISIVISEFIDDKKGKLLLLPLLLIGITSILYWIKFNDLRLYALVQFYPILAIPVILSLFKSDTNSAKGFWYLLIAYVIAKLLEKYDTEVHETLKFISGHSLKHIMASIGIFIFTIIYIQKNKLMNNQKKYEG